ncbi:cytochrome b/b6 domain-containing protein [Palleronia sp. LCG004]|uniref:cytochrome b/b6 domain-containing protein n=1 Tax=Palleronia sp. LCG004 TaxID=3079304 RepID=UPI0029420E2E|nr:cytochrome b/b6 domain-containing protein [Palleronia sp. LCG004]WOI55715.1 cytochrome b/b6 domain-containing protein [Palleronia sp. LCG004]
MTESATARTVRVWDPFVRVFHWSQVALIGAAWLTEDGPKWLHENAGYLLAALIAIRLVWGIVGSRYARFSDFVRGPRAVALYLGELSRGRERRHLGHNPAGGAMIVTLLTTVTATILTGWLQTTDMFWGSSAMEKIHEVAAILVLVLAAIHVAGVVFESLRHHENLVGAMIHGRKRVDGKEAP